MDQFSDKLAAIKENTETLISMMQLENVELHHEKNALKRLVHQLMGEAAEEHF